jgi:hypothetical protein
VVACSLPGFSLEAKWRKYFLLCSEKKEISFLVGAADGNILISLTYLLDMLDFKDTDKNCRAKAMIYMK